MNLYVVKTKVTDSKDGWKTTSHNQLEVIAHDEEQAKKVVNHYYSKNSSTASISFSEIKLKTSVTAPKVISVGF